MGFARGHKFSRGRKLGSKNVVPAALKDLILHALSNVGGVTYLETQATENPNAFLALVGRILPLQVKDGGADPVMPRQPLYQELPRD